MNKVFAWRSKLIHRTNSVFSPSWIKWTPFAYHISRKNYRGRRSPTVSLLVNDEPGKKLHLNLLLWWRDVEMKVIILMQIISPPSFFDFPREATTEFSKQNIVWSKCATVFSTNLGFSIFLYSNLTFHLVLAWERSNHINVNTCRRSNF